MLIIWKVRQNGGLELSNEFDNVEVICDLDEDVLRTVVGGKPWLECITERIWEKESRIESREAFFKDFCYKNE